MRQHPKCWLAQFIDTPCDGRLDPIHLVPQRLLKREFPFGVWAFEGDEFWMWKRSENEKRRGPGTVQRSLDDLLQDPRIIRAACRQHHYSLDVSRKLKIPRSRLPESVEEFAAELGRPIPAWLDGEYGPLEAAA